MKISTTARVALVAFGLAQPALGSERPYRITEVRETCSNYQPLKQPLFGDTHIHTRLSMDASVQDTRNTPDDAYRFARGERIGLQPYDAEGKAIRSAKLRRPLDWTALSDHAEMLGEVRICSDETLDGYDSDICWNKRYLGPRGLGGFLIRTMVAHQRLEFCGEQGAHCRDVAKTVWQEVQDAAERAYDRSSACTFTSLIGYEWTAAVGGAFNLHRNVLFRNDQVPDYALSSVEAVSAFDLFQGLERDCSQGKPDCEAIVVPHNSNISGPGLMFETARLVSQDQANFPVDPEEARLRKRYESVIEIMQHKGDSECLLSGDTTDEACGFEKVPYDNMSGAARFDLVANQPPKRAAFVREALKKGLLLEEESGVNPLKYGFIASTDTHLGTPGLVAENDAKGQGGAGPNMAAGIPPGLPDNIEFNPGGLAVVWAEENSRDSIFSALIRRETYGTSGTRPVVRFFGGWEYPSDLCESDSFVERGYEGGVPMGGDLQRPPSETSAPRFAVLAAQDPGIPNQPGTPLQRVQIVKGWVEDGKSRERVYDVAGGENGARVDTRTCETSGGGARQLCSVWTDPDFEPHQRSFYYVRVLENPTCRWHQHLCSQAAVDCSKPETVTRGFESCCNERFPKTVQERAWTSPIWYSPDEPTKSSASAN
ncbi:DUF3604 domain-containing protein [Myxococcota bacterium]|nr:DUF3604 domain-containing protein [Myxococcota bacterium]